MYKGLAAAKRTLGSLCGLMYIYEYVCMCMCVYICICIYLYEYIYIYIKSYVCVSMYDVQVLTKGIVATCICLTVGDDRIEAAVYMNR